MVKTTVFLRHMRDFPLMNEAYVAGFGDHRPARSAFAVAELPMVALVEIEAWAYAPARPGRVIAVPGADHHHPRPRRRHPRRLPHHHGASSPAVLGWVIKDEVDEDFEGTEDLAISQM